MTPLAERLRPRTLDEYVGQQHLVGQGAPLRRMIESGHVSSFILWGPPGVGKTTLANIIARRLDVPFFTLSATAAGVKGMTLDLNDRILWVGQPAAADQMLLLTERGFGKRVPYTDYEPQARGGKGVKTFYYQKSGSNGTRIAGAALITAPGQNVVIHQKTSKPTQLSADEVILQSKQDRGMPYVMALMDDTVTGVTIV